MKHSAPIKYPVRFLIFALAFSLAATLALTFFLYFNWQAKSQEDPTFSYEIVSQLNRLQFERAFDIIKEKNTN